MGCGFSRLNKVPSDMRMKSGGYHCISLNLDLPLKNQEQAETLILKETERILNTYWRLLMRL